MKGQYFSFDASGRGESGEKVADSMKGQYFSFDAIIATVIMVIAISSLLAYWVSVQSVVDSRTNPAYADALRIAESLLSPGEPAAWESVVPPPGFSGVRQLGISNGFGNAINRTKLNALNSRIGNMSGPADPKYPYYLQAGKIMRAPSNYYILVESTNGITPICGTSMNCIIGWSYPPSAKEVVVAHRGGQVDGVPVRIRVFLWRQ